MLTIEIDGREALTIQQAARRVRVTRNTIYNWMRTNKVEWRRLAGGGVRIFADTLVQTDKCNRYTPKGPDANSK